MHRDKEKKYPCSFDLKVKNVQLLAHNDGQRWTDINSIRAPNSSDHKCTKNWSKNI